MLISLLFCQVFCHTEPVYAQDTYTFQGRVLSATDNEPLPGASVIIRGTQRGAITDERGVFTFSVTGTELSLHVSFIGYRSLDTLLMLPLKEELVIRMAEDAASLGEVAVTGYQRIPKERATGSFVQLDNELLSRSVSTNLLDRLHGVASGVFLAPVASQAGARNLMDRQLNVRIRGESSLSAEAQVSRDPLIVVDNFPFEGTLENINPNDVESITVLRDAAAASIWGARAGNGVIVITTKKGIKEKPISLEFNTNFTMIEKPALYRDRNYLTADHFIDVERTLFNAGYFNADLSNVTTYPVLSPVVEMLGQVRSGQLTESEAEAAIANLSSQDIRQDYLRHVYRNAFNQQYSIGLKGGSRQTAYSMSAGVDRNRDNLVGNDFNRLTLASNITYTLSKRLNLTAALNYSTHKTTTNNFQNNFGSLSVGGKYGVIYPYARFADEAGTPLSIAKDYRSAYIDQAHALGFLDWQYRPLEETLLGDKYVKADNLLLRLGLKYDLGSSMNFEVMYQNERQTNGDWDNRSEATYYTRNLINRFSVRNENGTFTYPVPRGGVLIQTNTELNSDNLRAQLNYDKAFGADHRLVALVGTEARQLVRKSWMRTSYGYDDDLGVSVNNLNYSAILPTNPGSIGLISSPPGGVNVFNNRFVSLYANSAYTFRNRYTLSASARRDGSNIFGANTNHRFTPLWSVGGLWDVSREGFYNLDWLPYLKFRTSYGYSGNVYQGSVYTTGVYVTNPRTGARYIHNLTAPNPDLKWEQVGTFNTGIEFALKGNILRGSIEYYRKSGRDLIEVQPLAPSIGFARFNTNGAGTQTQGIDLNISARLVKGAMNWTPTFWLSTVRDKITDFSVNQTAASIRTTTGRPGIIGRPLYSVYSYRWGGLDPANGDPQGYLNGEISKNYTGILNNFSPDSLVFHGSSVPTIFGSVRNDFSFRGISLSFNLVYKLGYFFRRQGVSPNYQDVLSGYTHQDYALRWQNPGDEMITDVPSFVYPNNANRSTFYQFSEERVEKGDHIRFQDIRLSYDFPVQTAKALGIQSAQLYTYMNNIGMVWTANKLNIDPDTQTGGPTSHILPRPFSVALGIRVNF